MWFEVKTLQDAGEILEHRRARLRELLDSGVPSAELRSQLSATLANVEQQLYLGFGTQSDSPLRVAA